MVATVAEKGYEATTVADLVKLSGVSRSAFYRHFADKEECFLAAAEALIEPTLGAIRSAEGAPTGEERARQALEAFLEPDRSPAGRLEDVLRRGLRRRARRAAAGREDARRLRGASSPRCSSEIPGARGDAAEMVRAMIGGLQKVIHKRLYRDEEDQLIGAGAADLASGGSPTRRPRGSCARRAGARRNRAPSRSARRSPTRPSECCARWPRSVAEKGYPATTVAEVVDRAATSQRTFYEHFANKEEALIAALDSGSAQMLATTLPAFRRAADWQSAVHGAYEAMFAFGIEEPEYSRLGAVEMYAAGQTGAADQRDTIMEGLEALLAPGYELAPERPPIAAEAIGGAIYALVYDQVKAKGRRACRSWSRWPPT